MCYNDTMDNTDLTSLTHKDLELLTIQTKVRILGVYLKLCNQVEVDADNIYRVEDVKNITADDLKYMAAFINICSVTQELFETQESVLTWLRRPRNDYPFSNKSPLELIQSGTSGLLETRVYINSLKVHLHEIVDSLTGNQ